MEHTLPKFAGYTIRGKYIVENQRKEGLDPIIISSPLQEKTNRSYKEYEEIEGFRYYRTGQFNKLDLSEPLIFRLLKRYKYSRGYLKGIKWVASHEGVDIIHSHSSYLNGVRANAAAKALGIPSVYEVRGLWQDTASINEDLDSGSWKYKFISYMDRKAMLGADRVVTLSTQLMNELAGLGVKKDRLFIVPNGVDTNVFIPQDKNTEIIQKYGLENMIVFGFIGTIRKIEGLSLFIEKFQSIIKKTDMVRVLFIGHGDEIENLKKIVHSRNLDKYVHFVGSVPHNEVLDYYSVIDILLYPRIDAKVNHKVTPLKPLEAMAMKKVVIASDVGGLTELVKEGTNGLLFKAGDGEHFIKRCLEVIENPDMINSLGEKAREWVVRKRDWSNIIKLYNNVYEGLAR